MTIEQADWLAEAVSKAPHIYDSIPSLDEGMKPRAGDSYPYQTYPWVSLAKWMGGGLYSTDTPRNPNVYYSPYGFSTKAYSSVIKDWKATEMEFEKGTWTFGKRYVTIDDIRMMAYLGLEYAKAKLDGWRYRYGFVSGLEFEAEDYLRGYIARVNDGARYIHRVLALFGAAPPGSGGPYSDSDFAYRAWTPMRRLPGYDIPTQGTFTLPEDYELPAEATSQIVQLGTLEGNDDIVKFAPYQSKTRLPDVLYLYAPDSLVTEGGFEIIVTTSDSLSEEDVESSFVAYQQRVQKVYQISVKTYDSRGRVNGSTSYETLQTPPKGADYKFLYLIDSNSSPVPLRKGVVYNVFAKFDSAVMQQNKSNPELGLISYVRYGTRKVAPFMWQSDIHNHHQSPA